MHVLQLCGSVLSCESNNVRLMTACFVQRKSGAGCNLPGPPADSPQLGQIEKGKACCFPLEVQMNITACADFPERGVLRSGVAFVPEDCENRNYICLFLLFVFYSHLFFSHQASFPAISLQLW